MIRQFNGINRWYYRKGGLISQLLLHGIYERRMGGQLEGSYNIDIETKRYDAFWKNGYIFDNDRDMSVGLILKGSLQELESTYGRRKYDGSQLSFYSNLIFQTQITQNNKISVGWSTSYDRFVEDLQNVLAMPLSKSTGKKEFVSGVFAEYTLAIETLRRIYDEMIEIGRASCRERV